MDSIFYLMFVYWALRLGRRVFMVNAMFSDCPRSPRCQATVTAAAQLLGRSAAVCARDPRSRIYAERVLGLRQCICIPDALFTWLDKVEMQWTPLNSRLLASFGGEDDAALQGCDLRGGYVCLSASSSAAWRPQQAVVAYAALIRQLRRRLGVPLLVVQTCGGESFLRESARAGGGVFVDARLPIMQGLNLLAHARLYISGRWHPGIMAALGGTPCIFMRANSHKCRALQEQLGSAEPMEFPDIPDQAAISAICKRALQVLNADTVQRREQRRETAQALARQAQALAELLESR